MPTYGGPFLPTYLDLPLTSPPEWPGSLHSPNHSTLSWMDQEREEWFGGEWSDPWKNGVT